MPLLPRHLRQNINPLHYVAPYLLHWNWLNYLDREVCQLFLCQNQGLHFRDFRLEYYYLFLFGQNCFRKMFFQIIKFFLRRKISQMDFKQKQKFLHRIQPTKSYKKYSSSSHFSLLGLRIQRPFLQFPLLDWPMPLHYCRDTSLPVHFLQSFLRSIRK